MAPEALIVHKTDDRLRIRIPSKKGNTSYFEDVSSAFSGSGGFERMTANAATGSLLFTGEGIDAKAIAALAGKKSLFRLESHDHKEKPVAYHIAEPIGQLSAFLSKCTVGQLDMPTIAFLALLGVGIRQIVTGNFRSPPWYTAFWYAFGVFSKSIADKAKAYENETMSSETAKKDE